MAVRHSWDIVISTSARANCICGTAYLYHKMSFVFRERFGGCLENVATSARHNCIRGTPYLYHKMSFMIRERFGGCLENVCSNMSNIQQNSSYVAFLGTSKKIFLSVGHVDFSKHVLGVQYNQCIYMNTSCNILGVRNIRFGRQNFPKILRISVFINFNFWISHSIDLAEFYKKIIS